MAPSDITFYRLQCDSEGQLRAYIIQQAQTVLDYIYRTPLENRENSLAY